MKSKTMHLRLTEKDVSCLELFLHHALDAASGDTRPDHGLAMMKKFSQESRWALARIRRRCHQWRMK